MIIETLKATDKSGITHYLYWGGILRSHTIYHPVKDISEVNFKRLNGDDGYLSGELSRVCSTCRQVERVKIEVDSNYKFIQEVTS